MKRAQDPCAGIIAVMWHSYAGRQSSPVLPVNKRARLAVCYSKLLPPNFFDEKSFPRCSLYEFSVVILFLLCLLFVCELTVILWMYALCIFGESLDLECRFVAADLRVS